MPSLRSVFELMAADDVPAETEQDRLAVFVRSLGVKAERTGETYDSLVRMSLEWKARRLLATALGDATRRR